MRGLIDMSWFWTKRANPPQAPESSTIGMPGSVIHFRPAPRKTLLHDWRRYDGKSPVWIPEDSTIPLVGEWTDWGAE